jgi:hypothetical protein
MKTKEVINFILYHGTSESADKIREYGLISGGQHDVIYLTDNPQLALEYAESDQDRTGYNNIVLVSVNIKNLDKSKLYGDIDHSNIEDWRESLRETDQCIYQGSIPPNVLKIEDYTNE